MNAPVEVPVTPRLCRLVVIAAALCSGCGYWHEPNGLASAARSGDLGEIDRLVAAGADVNEGSGVNGWPPVLHAIHKHQLASLERLFEHGAFIHGETGRVALEMAERDDVQDILHFLRDHGVQANTAK